MVRRDPLSPSIPGLLGMEAVLHSLPVLRETWKPGIFRSPLKEENEKNPHKTGSSWIYFSYFDLYPLSTHNHCF